MKSIRIFSFAIFQGVTFDTSAVAGRYRPNIGVSINNSSIGTNMTEGPENEISVNRTSRIESLVYRGKKRKNAYEIIREFKSFSFRIS